MECQGFDESCRMGHLVPRENSGGCLDIYLQRALALEDAEADSCASREVGRIRLQSDHSTTPCRSIESKPQASRADLAVGGTQSPKEAAEARQIVA